MNLLLILKTNFVMQKNLKTPGITLICSYPIYFFSHIFNIPQSYLCNHRVNAYDIGDDDDGPDLTKREVMKIKSLYQILYYNLHGGKEKTPLHLFITVYTKSAKAEKF